MQLGWIDFSKTERSKILSVLDILSQGGTLDELGIAPVRDGFSDLFFPGTSTLQTRAKYFFLIPYALKEIELSRETVLYKALKSLDETEKYCGEELLSINPDENGIIGKRSLQNGKWVKRSPSDIYWAGLRKYNIFIGGNLSLSEYVNAACVQKEQKSTYIKLGNRNDNAEENETDDKNAGDVFKFQFWNMPLYCSDWKSSIQMQLTKDEAAFLRRQIIESCPDTMLSYILDNNLVSVLYVNRFSDLKEIISDFPQSIQDTYYLALAFSDFIFVIRTLYNIIISDGQNEKANKLFETQKDNFSQIADVDIDLIFNALDVHKQDLKNFVKNLQVCMVNNDIEGMKKAIKSREIVLKGERRAKTAHPGEFIDWMGGGELDYRFSNAKAIIRDIFESEGLLNAQSE